MEIGHLDSGTSKPVTVSSIEDLIKIPANTPSSIDQIPKIIELNPKFSFPELVGGQ